MGGKKKEMKDMAVERQEALNAGWKALTSLNDLKAELDSASNWGILDMFGGKTFTTFVKYSKLNNASQLALKASLDLQDFQREAKDVFPLTDLQCQVGGLLAYMDFFHDSFFVDLLVQSRINEALDKVDEAINTVTRLIDALESQ